MKELFESIFAPTQIERDMMDKIESKGLELPTSINEAVEVATALKLNAEEMDTLQGLAKL